MNASQALKKLESLGTAQNRKVYARHGVGPPLFGVSYAHLGKLARELAGEHELALALWASGNHDARVLATMIADPGRLSARELLAWGKELVNYAQSDALAKLAAGSPQAAAVQAKWLAATGEWQAAAGWVILGWRLREDPASIAETELARHLGTIETRIHTEKNLVRYAMNGALIAIGVASPALRAEAVGTARRIGPVEVDHGETGCKTPDAAGYIKKVVAHRSKKAGARRKTKATRRGAG